MLKFELLRDRGILVLEPHGALSAKDFQSVAQVVDPFIQDKGTLEGLLIQAAAFPGWDSFAAFVGHIRFIHDHHRAISKVAVVTDSSMLTIAPKIVAHFAHPQFKVFQSGDMVDAMTWLHDGHGPASA